MHIDTIFGYMWNLLSPLQTGPSTPQHFRYSETEAHSARRAFQRVGVEHRRRDTKRCHKTRRRLEPTFRRRKQMSSSGHVLKRGGEKSKDRVYPFFFGKFKVAEHVYKPITDSDGKKWYIYLLHDPIKLNHSCR